MVRSATGLLRTGERQKRARRQPPGRHHQLAAAKEFGGGEVTESCSKHLHRVEKLPDGTRWEAAEDKEIASLIKHQVYDVVPITSVRARSKFIGWR